MLSTPARLSLALDQPANRAVVAAFAAIVGHAVATAAGAAPRPARAVHEYRKALRRARALVRLLRAALPARAYARLLAALRAARRATSRLRDVDVLLTLCRTLVQDGQARPGDLAPLVGRLNARRRAGRGRSAAILGRAAARLSALPGELDAALPAELDRDALEDGLRAAYRRARRAHRRADSGGDDDFHDWRKLTKELAYQLELLTCQGGRAARRLQKRYAALAEAQGEVTDLLVLRAHVRGEPRRAVRPLDRLIERRSRKLEREAELFARSPRRFARAAMALIAP